VAEPLITLVSFKGSGQDSTLSQAPVLKAFSGVSGFDC